MGDEHWMYHSSKVCRHLHSWWGTKSFSSDPKLLSERVHFLMGFDPFHSRWAESNTRNHRGRENVNQALSRFFLHPLRRHKPWRWHYGGPWCRHSCPPTWTAPLLPTQQETHCVSVSHCSHFHLSQENKTHLNGKRIFSLEATNKTRHIQLHTQIEIIRSITSPDR